MHARKIGQAHASEARIYSLSGLGYQPAQHSPNIWPSIDRQLLLTVPQLGLEVIDKLRAVGISMQYDLSLIGADRAVEMVR